MKSFISSGFTEQFLFFSQVIMFQERHQKRLLTHYQQRVRDICCVLLQCVFIGVCVCLKVMQVMFYNSDVQFCSVPLKFEKPR